VTFGTRWTVKISTAALDRRPDALGVGRVTIEWPKEGDGCFEEGREKLLTAGFPGEGKDREEEKT
jgi:hypothetical protein